MSKELPEIAQEMGLNLGVHTTGNEKVFKRSEFRSNLFKILMERANWVGLKRTFHQFMSRITGPSCLQQQESDMGCE